MSFFYVSLTLVSLLFDILFQIFLASDIRVDDS